MIRNIKRYSPIAAYHKSPKAYKSVVSSHSIQGCHLPCAHHVAFTHFITGWSAYWWMDLQQLMFILLNSSLVLGSGRQKYQLYHILCCTQFSFKKIVQGVMLYRHVYSILRACVKTPHKWSWIIYVSSKLSCDRTEVQWNCWRRHKEHWNYTVSQLSWILCRKYSLRILFQHQKYIMEIRAIGVYWFNSRIWQFSEGK